MCASCPAARGCQALAIARIVPGDDDGPLMMASPARAALALLLPATACGEGASDVDGAPPDAPAPPDASQAFVADAQERPDAVVMAPDLILLPDLMTGTLRFETIDIAPDACELQEQCVTGTGPRRVLRFDTVSANMGPVDLLV